MDNCRNSTLILNQGDELTEEQAVTILKGIDATTKPRVAGVTVSPEYLKELREGLQALTGELVFVPSDCPFSLTPIFEKKGQKERALCWGTMDELQAYLKS